MLYGQRINTASDPAREAGGIDFFRLRDVTELYEVVEGSHVNVNTVLES